jgi:hypothetical protein
MLFQYPLPFSTISFMIQFHHILLVIVPCTSFNWTKFYSAVLLYVVMYIQWGVVTTLLQKCLLAPMTTDATPGHWYVNSVAVPLSSCSNLTSYSLSDLFLSLSPYPRSLTLVSLYLSPRPIGDHLLSSSTPPLALTITFYFR